MELMGELIEMFGSWSVTGSKVYGPQNCEPAAEINRVWMEKYLKTLHGMFQNRDLEFLDAAGHSPSSEKQKQGYMQSVN